MTVDETGKVSRSTVSWSGNDAHIQRYSETLYTNLLSSAEVAFHYIIHKLFPYIVITLPFVYLLYIQQLYSLNLIVFNLLPFRVLS